MPKNFWLLFAVQEAASVAGAYVAATPNLTDAQKKALEQLVTDAQAVALAFSS